MVENGAVQRFTRAQNSRSRWAVPARKFNYERGRRQFLCSNPLTALSRSLLITSIVFVEVGDFLRSKLNECFPALDGQCLSMFLGDDQPALFVDLLAERDRWVIIFAHLVPDYGMATAIRLMDNLTDQILIFKDIIYNTLFKF